MIEFKAVVDDGEILVVERLAREIWTEHFVPVIGMPQVEYMLNEFQSAAAIKRYLAQGYKYYLVNFDGVSAGYLAFLPKAGRQELFLSKFYLLLHYRGKGIGREMMGFVEDMARNGALKKVSLKTNKKNLDTICFYEKAGFTHKVSDVTDIGGGFVADDWLMEKAV